MKPLNRLSIFSLMLVFALLISACTQLGQTQPASSTAPETPAEEVAAEPTEEMSEAVVEAEPAEEMEQMEQTEQDIVEIASADGRFETLVTALTATDLVETLQSDGPFTVFAPTDEAFAALPAGTLDTLLSDPAALSEILLYHVVSGEVTAEQVVGLDSAGTVQGEPLSISTEGDSVMVNDAQVVITDIQASNGVIHVIDAVLLPPTDEAAGEMSEEQAQAEPAEEMEQMEQMEQDIVEIASADGRFETLVTALTATDLVETLKSDGPFTVFAPTDEAFAALPEGTLESLLDDPAALSEILLYHVVSGEVTAEQVVGLDSAGTVQGEPLSISTEGDAVMVNDAQVVITDIQASNGVIHVIDAVLLPPSGS